MYVCMHVLFLILYVCMYEYVCVYMLVDLFEDYSSTNYGLYLIFDVCMYVCMHA